MHTGIPEEPVGTEWHEAILAQPSTFCSAKSAASAASAIIRCYACDDDNDQNLVATTLHYSDSLHIVQPSVHVASLIRGTADTLEQAVVPLPALVLYHPSCGATECQSPSLAQCSNRHVCM